MDEVSSSALRPAGSRPGLGPVNGGRGADHTRARAGAAGRNGDLRRHLPGLEADRRVDDWGRSERMEGLLDRTVSGFLYRHWFRCDAEGLEHVPPAGGALLVANHGGALPPDGSMVVKAVQDEHARGRSVYLTVGDAVRAVPGLSMLLTKLGRVPAHAANVHRLLHDEEQLVLVFPEATDAGPKLYRHRYRLRDFDRGRFVAAAARAGVPIVPVCIVGAEEAAPVFARLGRMGRLGGFLQLSLTATFPLLGPLGLLAYLPAKFRIRFLEPMDVSALDPDRDPGEVQSAGDEVRARMQAEVLRMVGERRSVWFG